MSEVKLSTRQAQVAECVARGLPDKRIAAELGIDIETVRVHIQLAAKKLPGETSRRHKLTLFFLTLSDGST